MAAVTLSNAWLSIYKTVFPPQSIASRNGSALAYDGAKVACKMNQSNEPANESAVFSDSFARYTPDASEMRRVFDRLDENHDNLICAKDLGLCMKRLGFALTDEEVCSMLQTVDRNRDHLVDFEEFFSLFNTIVGEETSATPGKDDKEEPEEALREAFSVFDKDNDGYISAAELQRVLVNLGMGEGRSLMSCQKMIERVDFDGNGQVDFTEFKVLMCADAFQL